MVVAYRTGDGKTICISDWYGEAGACCGKNGWICISTTTNNRTEGAKTRFDLEQRK